MFDRTPAPAPGSEFMTPLASRIWSLAVERWGPGRAVEMVGHSTEYQALLSRLEKISRYREPVLITGESGAGKELLAQAIYLLTHPKGKPYVSVNCPQYREDNLTVSELFGHSKGSFTGAVADHRGAFEEADGGVIFLDEIADLHPGAQAMLLRMLSTGEFKPVGAAKTRTADVHVVSATNRPLNQLIMSGQFRYDLFFRLRKFHLAIPALRERGDDWRLIAEYCLGQLCQKYGVAKRFSAASLRILEGYSWPGNVRQLVGVTTTGYAMADGDLIEPDDFSSLLERPANETAATAGGDIDHLYERVIKGDEEFWASVYQPFMDRDLNRSQLRAIVKRGLTDAQGSYRRLLEVLRLPAGDYQRFMDFLRHHELKP